MNWPYLSQEIDFSYENPIQEDYTLQVETSGSSDWKEKQNKTKQQTMYNVGRDEKAVI